MLLSMVSRAGTLREREVSFSSQACSYCSGRGVRVGFLREVVGLSDRKGRHYVRRSNHAHVLA
jgi:hypothetical protein